MSPGPQVLLFVSRGFVTGGAPAACGPPDAEASALPHQARGSRLRPVPRRGPCPGSYVAQGTPPGERGLLLGEGVCRRLPGHERGWGAAYHARPHRLPPATGPRGVVTGIGPGRGPLWHEACHRGTRPPGGRGGGRGPRATRCGGGTRPLPQAEHRKVDLAFPRYSKSRGQGPDHSGLQHYRGLTAQACRLAGAPRGLGEHNAIHVWKTLQVGRPRGLGRAKSGAREALPASSMRRLPPGSGR